MRILKANSTLEPQLLEYIGSGSWRVRWNILSTDDGYSYTEADLNYNPSTEEIKDIISNWVRDSYKADSFYIDEHNFWLSDSERATIKSQCEFSSTTITCICKEKVITLDSSTALQMVYMMDSYANSCKESVELVVNKLASCSTLEEMNEVVKSIELPEVIYTTQEELIKLANSREKNSKSNQAILFAKMTINSTSLTDEQSLTVKNLYPEWEEFIGKSLTTGYKVLYNDSLYKVRQDISIVLADQYPSTATASLYEEICETHTGTKDDPIPYNNNMALESGKYYSQNNVIYLCTRDTGLAVYNDLSDLVGIYVQIAE